MEIRDEIREFVEEVLRTGLALGDILGALLEELPDDAFPGEQPAEVLLEMLAGTFRPAADAAGADTVRQATALIGALGDRAFRDLRTAAAAANR